MILAEVIDDAFSLENARLRLGGWSPSAVGWRQVGHPTLLKLKSLQQPYNTDSEMDTGKSFQDTFISDFNKDVMVAQLSDSWSE